jgi:hypothetical protein
MWAHTIDMKLMADAAALAYRRAAFKVLTRPFFYHFPTMTAATLNTKAKATLLIDQDSLFVVLALVQSKVHGICNVGPFVAAQDHAAGCGLRLTDLQGGYTFGEEFFVPSEAVAGSGQAPSILGFPYILAPGSRMQAEIVHLSGEAHVGVIDPQNTPIEVDLTLIGIKLVTNPFTRTILSPEM